MLNEVIFGVVEALYLVWGGGGGIPHDMAIKACFSFMSRVVILTLDQHSCPCSIFLNNLLSNCSGPSGGIPVGYSFIAPFVGVLLTYVVVVFFFFFRIIMSEWSFQHLFSFTKDSLSLSSAAVALDLDTSVLQQSAGGNDGSGGVGEDAGTGGIAQPLNPPHPGGDSVSTDPPHIETAGNTASPIPAEPSICFASPALAVVIPSQSEALGPSVGDTEGQEVGPPPEPSDLPVVLAGGPVLKYVKHSALNTTLYGLAHSWCC